MRIGSRGILAGREVRAGEGDQNEMSAGKIVDQLNFAKAGSPHLANDQPIGAGWKEGQNFFERSAAFFQSDAGVDLDEAVRDVGAERFSRAFEDPALEALDVDGYDVGPAKAPSERVNGHRGHWLASGFPSRGRD